MTRTGTRTHAKTTGLALLAALVMLALPSTGHATGILDQQQTITSNFSAVIRGPIRGPDSSPASAAQTFTPALSGGLDQVDLVLFRFSNTSAPLTVEVRDTSGGAPGASVLASASLPAAAVPVGFPGAFVSVPFTSPAPVLAGSQYAIIAYTDGAGEEYRWGLALFMGDVYAGGTRFFTFPLSPGFWFPDNSDLAFKTYVTVPLTSKSQCKNGGWRNFPQFKNQGQCVSFVERQSQT